MTSMGNHALPFEERQAWEAKRHEPSPGDKLRATIDALARLRDDPAETRGRRDRAAGAIDQALAAYPATGSVMRGPYLGGHSGGASLRADAEYDGWGTP